MNCVHGLWDYKVMGLLGLLVNSLDLSNFVHGKFLV